MVQVSMNLVNYEATGMAQAYEAVRDEAARIGVEVFSTEIVGLVPEKALDRNAEYFRKLENLTADKILENRLRICSQGST
jgi:glutamate formiminotransferase